MKTITIAGRLTRDAETRDASDNRVTNFAVAVDHWDGREKSAMFFECALWGSRGEKLAQYLTKGASVTVSGDFSTREYEGKTKLNIRVNDLTLQGGKQDGERRGGGGGEPQHSIDDQDIPFIRMAGHYDG